MNKTIKIGCPEQVTLLGMIQALTEAKATEVTRVMGFKPVEVSWGNERL